MLAVPRVSAQGLGAFRATIGFCLWWLIRAQTPSPQPPALHRNYSPLADHPLIHALAADAQAWQAILYVGEVAAVLFALGIVVRLSYATVVVALLLTRLAVLQSNGVHDWVSPMVILIALLAVPWHKAGFAVDRRWRRHPPAADDALPSYGFAVWVPGVITGLAFAAAAYSKLYESGLAWITTGAVAYHFIEDAPNAPVTLGLWVAAHEPVAVLFSGLAIATELAMLPLSLATRPSIRLLAGAVATSLFAGFYVFQGVNWWPWMMWLVAFLPWGGMRASAGRLSLSWPQRTIVGVLAGAQAIATVGRIEMEPLISPYQMYANTFLSPADYEMKRRRKFQLVEAELSGRRVQVDGAAGDAMLAAVDAVGAGHTPEGEAAAAVRAICLAASPLPPSITVHAERTRLDWTAPLVERRTSRVVVEIPCL